MSNTITGNKIIFKNPYTSQNITLQHHTSGYKLIFNSEVEFKQGIDYSEIKLGNFTIERNEANSKLLFKKNGKTLMSLEE